MTTPQDPAVRPVPSPLLETAIRAVREAGALQLAALGGTFTVEKKGVIDLVTEVDLAIERHVRALIAERHPDHVVLGEEFGGPADAAAAARACWIFDPIDGTTNFAHGVPIFCASLALELGGQLAVAAVYDPTRDELFTAERGTGAWLNDRRLSVSATDSLVDALLVTGFPYTVHQDPTDTLDLFGRFIKTSRAVRRLGSAALDVCYVAAGRMDGFWEQGLGAWDIAAAALLVEEAGGRVTDLDGGPFTARSGRMLATNGAIHGQMLEVIADFERDRSRNRTN
jgi:myo-inositol-1(or 4)-monophosphatase